MSRIEPPPTLPEPIDVDTQFTDILSATFVIVAAGIAWVFITFSALKTTEILAMPYPKTAGMIFGTMLVVTSILQAHSIFIDRAEQALKRRLGKLGSGSHIGSKKHRLDAATTSASLFRRHLPRVGVVAAILGFAILSTLAMLVRDTTVRLKEQEVTEANRPFNAQETAIKAEYDSRLALIEAQISDASLELVANNQRLSGQGSSSISGLLEEKKKTGDMLTNLYSEQARWKAELIEQETGAFDSKRGKFTLYDKAAANIKTLEAAISAQEDNLERINNQINVERLDLTNASEQTIQLRSALQSEYDSIVQRRTDAITRFRDQSLASPDFEVAPPSDLLNTFNGAAKLLVNREYAASAWLSLVLLLALLVAADNFPQIAAAISPVPRMYFATARKRGEALEYETARYAHSRNFYRPFISQFAIYEEADVGGPSAYVDPKGGLQ